ncbi:ABC transporter ATP-binding protein [Bacteroidia bacterium]|nr:ABC transporter ATP-binding protein [Bacteroidia bacterium]
MFSVFTFKKEIMFILQNISFIHSDREVLFDSISLSVNSKEKIAIIGNNGVGKSTLLKIIAGQLLPAEGAITVSSNPYYVPQIVGQFDGLTIAQVLGIEEKLDALSEILSGDVTDENLSVLDDDWTIEERCIEALSYWYLDGFDLNTKMETLSGGQKTKVFLAGIKIHHPEIVLLDEPTNHLDSTARMRLEQFITETSCAVVVVSHDRSVLNRLDTMCELNKHGIKIYGGNYEFYREQKQLESNALNEDVQSKEKALRKAKETAREAAERKRKIEERGKKQQKKEGTGKAMMDKLKNDAENSASRIKNVHADKIYSIKQELNDLRKEISECDKMKFEFDNSSLHRHKILVTATEMNFGYNENVLWKNPLDFQIVSGERIVIKGENGTGKTTLLKLILGDIEPTVGTIQRAKIKTVYIDQNYSLLNTTLSVYQQANAFNDGTLMEHEIKIRLNRFLFTKDFWDKPCAVLSGGEKMRLLLCCLTITNQSPDMIVLDEPTNNLDIQNIEILTAAINAYEGTLIIVSHDLCFLEQIKVGKAIEL